MPRKEETIIFIPDQHFPLHDSKALSCVLQAIEEVKPDRVVNIGDAGEWSTASHWEWAKKARPPIYLQKPMIKEEAAKVNAGLNLIDKACDVGGVEHRDFLQGNHEVWLDNFAEEDASDEFRVENLCHFGERNYSYHPYGQYVHYGRLLAYHGGHYTNKYHSLSHAVELGKSVIYGHHHSIQRMTHTSYDEVHTGWCIGCVCKLEKAFLKGKPTNWAHGFAVANVTPRGNFHVQMVDIIEGECRLWGQKIKGKKLR